MSIRVGEDGRRSVQVEVEVPGSPESVWEAVATGPGVSSWFVPTRIEERVGGSIAADFGPGMESTSTVARWDPPRSFVAEGSGMSPEAPPMATEWIVEAKSGGTCVVRVVHRWFASTDEWDDQFEMVEQGWNGFFKILRLKLERFPGQPGAAFDVAGMGDVGEAWPALTGPLGLTDAAVGAEVRAEAGAPALAGRVEIVDDGGGERRRVVLTAEPGTGVAHLFAMPMGGSLYLSVRFYLFGEAAAFAVAQAEPGWKGWFAERFPMVG